MTQISYWTPIRSSAYRWVILAFLVLICFLSHFNRASIATAGDERIMKQYGISPERMGMVYSSYLVVYTVFMIPGGWLIDRRGPKFAMAAMLLGAAIFCACTGLVGLTFASASAVLIALLIVRSAMGLCHVPLHPGAARSIDGWFPPGKTALANGLVTAASILAYSAVNPVFGKLIDWFDWPKAFLCTAAATLALCIAWWWIGGNGPFQRNAPPASPSGSQSKSAALEPSISVNNILDYYSPILMPLGRVRELTLLTASYAAVGYFQYLFFYWMHYYFDTVLKMGTVQSRYYAALPTFAMAIAMPIGGLLIGYVEVTYGRHRRFLVPLLGMLASAAFLLAGLLATRTGWVVGSFTLALACLGLCESAFWVSAIELGGNRAGTSAAIMNTGGNGVGLLAPLLTPIISRHFGWNSGLLMGALVAVVGAVCWLGVRRTVTTPTSALEMVDG